MATTHLQIPDIQANQNQKEVTANTAHDLLDKALNASVSVAMSAGVNNLTTTQARENFVIELTGTPGAPFTVEMPDSNKRTMCIVNNSDAQATVQNPSAGGTGQPVIAVGEASIFHFDGTDFFDLSGLALAVATFTGLTDTPGSYANQSGQILAVNNAEGALEFIKTAMKLPVRAATTGAGTLATDFENGDTIDGVVLATGDRILIKNQGTGSENGIYIVQATGAPVRAADFDDDADVEGGVAVAVQEGTVNADTFWVLDTNGTITVGSTSLSFSQMLSPGTFTSLTDTPANFTNHSGKQVRVNSGESALEFVAGDIKIPVRVATVSPGTLSTDFENGDSVDGVTLATGDRILIKDQGTASENGIYIVQATGSPVRALDFDDDADAVPGCIISVIEGTTNANTLWQLTTQGAITIGSTGLAFSIISGGTGGDAIATVQTTDNTQTTLASGAVASNKAVQVRAYGFGYNDSNGNTFTFDLHGAAQNEGGTTSAKGSTVNTRDPDGTGFAVAFDADDTTDVWRIRVTGALATTVDWKVSYETIDIGA